MHGQVLRNSLFKFVALALLVLMSPAACVTESPVAERVIAVGERVPEFSVILDNGEEWASHNSGGLPSVIAFFHTGCGDCRSELPELQEACRQSGDRVRFVCIAREEDAADIAAWWSDNGLSLPWSAQPDRRVYNMFANTGIPRIFIISADLKIEEAFGPEDAPSATRILNCLGKFI